MGNCSDWLLNTNIQRLAEERNLAVVMPSGDNSFYVDQTIPNNDYGRFIGEELVALTRRMFPLSYRREDTFIAGFSMGGFGALRNGLKYHETFGYIAVLSGALQIFEWPVRFPGRSLFNEDAVFGDIATAIKTDKNPRVTFQKMAETTANYAWPHLYMACGQEDALILFNRDLCTYFQQNGMNTTWVEVHGGHNWNFWRSQLASVLNGLPLDAAASVLSSGNVRG